MIKDLKDMNQTDLLRASAEYKEQMRVLKEFCSSHEGEILCEMFIGGKSCRMVSIKDGALFESYGELGGDKFISFENFASLVHDPFPWTYTDLGNELLKLC